MPDLQPCSDRLCDTGVSRPEVAREFEGMPVDLSWVTPGWECKRGRWGTGEEATVKRAREFVEWVTGREEEEIVIVSHRESLDKREDLIPSYGHDKQRRFKRR